MLINRSDSVKSLRLIKAGIKQEDRSLPRLAAVYHFQRGAKLFSKHHLNSVQTATPFQKQARWV